MKKEIIKLAITGSSGFIGRNIIKELLGCSNVKVTSHFNSKNKNFNSLKNEMLIYNYGNLMNKEDLSKFTANSELLLHLAFNRINLKDNLTIANNISDTINEREDLKLIHISTTDVYNGNSGKIKDTDIPKPKGSYSKNKYEIEKIFRSKINKDKVKIIRISDVFGKEGRGLMTHINRCKKLPLWIIRVFIHLKKNHSMSYISSKDLIRILTYFIYNYESMKSISLLTDDRIKRNNYEVLYDYLIKNLFTRKKLFYTKNLRRNKSRNKFQCSNTLKEVLDSEDNFWDEVLELVHS